MDALVGGGGEGTGEEEEQTGKEGRAVANKGKSGAQINGRLRL